MTNMPREIRDIAPAASPVLGMPATRTTRFGIGEGPPFGAMKFDWLLLLTLGLLPPVAALLLQTSRGTHAGALRPAATSRLPA